MADATTTQNPASADFLNNFFKRGDIALALGIVFILSVLILPMPTWLLDVMLAFSFSFSVLILMTVLFIDRPLDFSSFPTVILVSTLLRLSLNLASTRLILAHGHEGTAAAGHVIEAFGNFIMAGNFVIGIIVFSILVLVNFVVITKGSGRIAEVSARFTLDAMPGKQMAIDADLSSGLITEDEARKKRKEIEQESGFYGAMDGAAKFVRGDAIAGLIITVINIVAGIIIGTAQMGLDLDEATRSYTLLTVGDGLVTQIPALIVSTASGLLVTKGGGASGSAEKALFSQLGGYPAALGLSSFLMLTMAALPGVPMLPFLILGGGMGALAYLVNDKIDQQKVTAERQAVEATKVPISEQPIAASLQIDLIRLELGYGLLSLINKDRGVVLTDQIKALRRQLAGEMGFVLPSVRIQDNLQLAANNYVIRIKEIEAGRGEVRPNMFMVMDPRGEAINMPGEATTEPTFGLPAMWVNENLKEEAQFKNYTVVDPATVITTHVTELVKDYMPELLSFTETQKLLDELDKDQQKLVAEITPTKISVGGIQRVLQILLGERISIRDLPTILEGIAEATGTTRNVATIAEHVRHRLARQLSEANVNMAGVIPIIALSPEWEQAFSESIIGQGDERQLAMPPSKLQQFIGDVRSNFDRMAMMGEMPVLLTSPAIRPFVRSIIERFRPQTVVLSQLEIHPKAKIKTMGQI